MRIAERWLHGPQLRHPYPNWRFEVMTRVGVRCVSSPRRDLRGGWRAIAVPTATYYISRTYKHIPFRGYCLENPGPAAAVSTCSNARPVRGVQSGLRSGPRARQQRQRRGAPRACHWRGDPAMEFEDAGRCLSRMLEDLHVCS
jgi:hypothetical protein